MARELTPRQKEVLEFINSKRFVPPTVRQIAQHVQLSRSAVQVHVEALRKKGYLPEGKSD